MTTTEPSHSDAHDTVDAGVVNMGGEELVRDPFGEYSRIREEAPMVRGAVPGVEPVWLATRYEDVKTVLSDSRFVNNPANVPGMEIPNLSKQLLMATHRTPQEYLKYRVPQMGSFDGLDHARLRTLVSKAFTVRRIARLRPQIEMITEDLLARLPGLADDSVVDLLPQFAYPLPSTVLCELFGLPDEDRPQWREWHRVIWSVKEHDKKAAWGAMVGYIQGLIDRRRVEPTDDLTSALIQAEIGRDKGGRKDGDRLSDTEITTMIITLALGGHQTTADLIGSGTAALLRHPDQLALLRANPDLLPRAVHELLRWCTPTHAVRMRYATEDIEVGGVVVRKGEAVRPLLIAANYDPRMFDEPERLDITRDPGDRRETHVAFAYGAHYCLGAALARMEGEVAFGTLLRRYPDLTLAIDPQDLEYEVMPGQWRILTSLPVRL